MADAIRTLADFLTFGPIVAVILAGLVILAVHLFTRGAAP